MRLLTLIILTLTTTAKAEDLIPTTALSPVTSSSNKSLSPAPYAQGSKFVTLYGGYAGQPNGTREQLSFCTAGLNYYFADNWGFAVEFTGLGAAQPDHDIAAGGGDVLLRTHLLNTQRFSFFGDVAVGVLEANDRIPPSGTDFNFTFQSGIGTAIHLDPRTDFFLGLRYYHLSNARQKGPDRNPSLNAIQCYAGFIFRT